MDYNDKGDYPGFTDASNKTSKMLTYSQVKLLVLTGLQKCKM